MELYQQTIYKSKYARWDEEKGRRENWDETVDRYINFFKERNSNREDIPWVELRNAIYKLEVMPSMRALMTAGRALDRDNIAGYNCSYIPIDSPRAFDEAMYILMCGCGVGFSVERQHINKLPDISEEFHKTDTTIVVRDSRIGWATGFRELLSLLWSGQIPKWDLSKLRPYGSKLKTFGGKSSGPEPLDDLFRFSVNLFSNSNGRKLTSIECHDLMCMVAKVVVAGGVRRSACISLSNLSDDRMRAAKSGQWWLENVQRRLANNSAVYTEKPDMGIFIAEWQSLYESKSGERGIVNRQALKRKVEETERRDPNYDFGLNPCAEIILRGLEVCNLTEVIVREDDNYKSLQRKVRLAVILGTLQATLTDLRYLRAVWKKNIVEEALLGVSFTGIMDNDFMSNSLDKQEQLESELNDLKKYAIKVNKKYANLLDIEEAKAITCVKPSGTVSQLVNSSSGIHARQFPFYIRRITLSKSDTICKVLMDSGIPYEECVHDKFNYIFSFIIKSPDGAICTKDIDAISQLNHWLIYQDNWCEHNPSCTIYVKEDEWLKVGAWVYEHFDNIGGLSFLPTSDHIYQQAPYEELTEEEYNERITSYPTEINWDLLASIEQEDNTTATHEFSCIGDKCEII